MKLRLMAVVGICLLGMLARPANAQEITGQIRGTVTDATGGAVVGAKVDVANTDRNQVVRSLQTNSVGEYVATLLPLGKYTVTISAPGFKKFEKRGIELNVSDRITVDAILQAGAVSETVVVEAEAIEVNLANASVEGLVTGPQVRELPLNNRNYEQLVTLMPGVTSNAADQIYVGTTNPSGQVNIVSFSVSGNRQSQNNWTIDGADNVDHGSNITLLVYPSVDAIAEFKIERSNYSPEFGRTAAGQINVITRSGTARFHGDLYEFFRNDFLNANNSFNKFEGIPRPVLRYNNFGGTIGGPLYIPGVYNKDKSKTFFFFSEELRRVTTPVAQTATVPTSLERQGIFRQPVCVAIDSTGACTQVGTTISPSNIDPIAAAYIRDVFSKIPLPANDSGALASTFPGVFNYREELLRIDHNVTKNFSLMGRLIFDHIPTQEPFGLFGPQSSVPNVANTKTDSPGSQYMIRATNQIALNQINELGFAYSYGAIVSDPTGALASSKSPDVSSLIKLPYPRQLNRVPNLLFDDGFDSLAGFGQYRDYNRNYNLFDNFTWTRGRHSFKFGFQYIYYQKNENAAGDNAGNYEFDSTNIPAPLDSQTGADIATQQREQDFANFLLGYASSDFLQAPTDITADIRQNLFEFYGQDEWRIRPNLTISYGLRYSFFRTPSDSGFKLTSFDPRQYNVANAPELTASGRLVLGTGNPLNGIIINGVRSPYGNHITRQDDRDIAPRFGIAWDPFSNGRTSLRAGFGLFYDSVAAGIIEDNVFNNPPFLGSSDFGGGIFLSQGDQVSALSSNIPPSLWTTNPRWTTPYSTQWNLTVQRMLGRSWLIEVGYVGNKGTHLVGVQDINQVAPGAAVAAGFIAPGAVYSGSSSAQRKLNRIRPYLGYSTIGQISPTFYSNYNALQTSITKRFTGSSSFNANYTWSHGLTNNQTDRSTGLQWTYCPRCEYGRSQLDRRHVFTANFIYELPWYREQKDFKSRVLGGYQLTSILTVNSGLPYTVFGIRANGDPAAAGISAPGAPNNGRVATPRPNQNGDPNANAPHNWDHWFDASVFSTPTVGGASGNERRGAVNGPGLWRVDLALLKDTTIAGSANLQFRFETFNVFNHTNPSTISASQSSAFYNKVTSTRDPRILQLALKFSF